MGFLRRLFGCKKAGSPAGGTGGSGSKSGKDKRRWNFVKLLKDKSANNAIGLSEFDPSTSSAPFSDSLDANKHAIAVAAATAAVAEAALAAAHAAAEVVRLTSGNNDSSSASTSSRPATAGQISASQRRWAEESAAVKIQSAFRGYLARRALRALKALVRLQALVRGHIVRKQSADMLRRMQTLVRLQTRARASRAHLSDHLRSSKSSLSHHPVPEEYEHPLRAYSTKFDGSSILKRCSSHANFRDIDSERVQFGSNWLDRWMEESVWNHPRDASLKAGHTDDEKSDKILEVDTWKPHLNSHRSSSSFQASRHYLAYDYGNENFIAYDSPKRSTKALNQSLLSREALSLSSLKFHEGKEVTPRTAENSPQAFSTTCRRGNGARRGPFTPTRSECSWGFFNGYAGRPNYMANTESSRAKVRSQSAPRQRLEFERCGSSRRSVQGPWDAGPTSDSDADFRSIAYPASSRLNRIGSVPI